MQEGVVYKPSCILQPTDSKSCEDLIMSIPPAYSAHHAPMLMEVVRKHIRAKHYSRCADQSYMNWIKRFVHFAKD